MKKCLLFAISILCLTIAQSQQPVLKIPTAHTGMINGFDVSHNGKLIATASVGNKT